jgi:hypothetical protein
MEIRRCGPVCPNLLHVTGQHSDDQRCFTKVHSEARLDDGRKNLGLSEVEAACVIKGRTVESDEMTLKSPGGTHISHRERGRNSPG